MSDAVLDEVRSRLQARFRVGDPETLQVIDDGHLHAGHAGARDGGRHLRLRIVSPVFTGLGALSRHRLVYDCLSDLMPRPIHALAMRLSSPEDPGTAADSSTPRE